jgi:hypothetical protein
MEKVSNGVYIGEEGMVRFRITNSNGTPCAPL